MKVREYIRDHWLLYAGWILFMILTVFIMWLTPQYPFDWGVVGYLFMLEGLLLFLFQAVDYFLQRRWWRRLVFSDKDRLLQSNITGSRTITQKLQEDYINRLIAEHQEMMQHMMSSQEEQKDYIDSWVHEIKVPVAALQLLLRSGEFDLSDEKYMTMDTELHRINDYVDQVLYVARLESFSKDYLIQEVEVKSMVLPIIREQANLFIQNNIHYQVNGDNDVVLTDVKWVSFIFRQLLTNALKYTSPGGKIEIDIIREPKELQLVIRDNGIGIPREDLKRIFDKGFTGTNGRNAGTHSTGLGLYLAKNLARKIGVELTVESEVGIGTEMTLHFPQLNYYQETR